MWPFPGLLCRGDAVSDSVRICPACLGTHSVRKNGHVQGRQRYRCNCGHQFLGGRPCDVIDAICQSRIKVVACVLLTLEVPVITIVKATGLSMSWLYQQRRQISAGSITPGQQEEGDGAE